MTADELTVAIDQDAASYDAVMAAFKLPLGGDEEVAKREGGHSGGYEGGGGGAAARGDGGCTTERAAVATGTDRGGIYEVRFAGGTSNGSSGSEGRIGQRGNQPGRIKGRSDGGANEGEGCRTAHPVRLGVEA